jgi:NTE family protein
MGGNSRIGIALGSGSARGWAHIGVLRALVESGIQPAIVCGTSIGALVGAAYADNGLDALESWVRKLTWRRVVGLFDISFAGGFIKGEKLIEFLRERHRDKDIAELGMPYAAVATDLKNGREVWLTQGRVSDAVRASIALPGLFTPVEQDGRLLVDGGLVNPVPVSLCRALGADFVIAVDLGSNIVGHYVRKLESEQRVKKLPGMVDVLITSINIMQVRVTRSRLAGDPADVVIAPRLGHLRVFDYHHAAEAIAEGRDVTVAMIPLIRRLLEQE